MRFEEALKYLRQGKKVRRKKWDSREYVYIENKNLNYSGRAYCLDDSFLLDNNWELYKEPILDKKEKEYLSAVIKPFKIRCITKSETISDLSEFITICLDNDEDEHITLPYFKKGTMYKGMKPDKNYTLKELGL